MTGWQEPVALLVVAATALLFIRHAVRSRRRARRCGSDCACGTPETGPHAGSPDMEKTPGMRF